MYPLCKLIVFHCCRVVIPKRTSNLVVICMFNIEYHELINLTLTGGIRCLCSSGGDCGSGTISHSDRILAVLWSTLSGEEFTWSTDIGLQIAKYRTWKFYTRNILFQYTIRYSHAFNYIGRPRKYRCVVRGQWTRPCKQRSNSSSKITSRQFEYHLDQFNGG